MAAPSTAPVFKQALLDALEGRPGLAGVQLTYGFVRNPESESIVLGRIQWEDEEWAALGNRRKQEDYWIDLFVWVQKKGLSQKEATERAFALLGEVELLLREQPLMAGVNLTDIEPVAVNEAPAGKEGYQALAEARVHVKARK